MIEPFYTYREISYVTIPFKLIGLVLLILLLCTKFFLIGIIVIAIVYFKMRNSYSKFKMFNEYIEVSNFFSKKEINLDEFLKAQISETQLYSSRVIILKTRNNIKLSFVPKNKYEGVQIIKRLEDFGIIFIKSNFYNKLKEWSIEKDKGSGGW